MTNQQLFEFFLFIVSAYCMEFCIRFDDAAEYRGRQVLKEHIPCLEELRIKLKIE